MSIKIVLVAACALVDPDGRVLLAQRPEGKSMAGLWEFPGGKVERGETLEACLRREIFEELGIEITVGQPITQVEHAYTHFRITLHAYTCQLVRGRPRPLEVADWRWVRFEELDDFAFAVTDRKIIRVLQEEQS